MAKTQTNVDKVIDGLLFDFNPKQRKVLEGRFALKGKRLTLQEIGDDLGVTRERVRQIESQGLTKLKPRVEETLGALLEAAVEFLDGVGGVRRDDYFVREMQHIGKISDTNHVDYKTRFIFLIGGTPQFHKEDNHFDSFWYADEKAREELFSFVKKLLEFFAKEDKERLLQDKVYLDKLEDMHSHHHVSISKHFDTNVFGDFGLSHWPEIRPKVVRDKAYLVLKKHGEPLHFEDIANFIAKLGIDEKPAHTQTVHNELIKDNRFILVGRGMYGLEEHGFEGGTVRDVIERILKEQGPLPSDEVVRRVGERKILKRNTILLNLQNRKYFRRLESGEYNVR